MIPPAELASIVEWCDERARLISDEVYHGLVYPGAPDTSCAWQTSRNAFVVKQLFQIFRHDRLAAAGLEVLRRTVDCLTGNFTICPVLSQHAAVAAFTPEAIAEAEGHLHHYARNRDLLISGLNRLGITRLAPADGAFYIYADVSDLGTDSLAFCSKLLAETGIAITPGWTSTRLGAVRMCGCHLPGPPPTLKAVSTGSAPWLS